MLLVMDVGNSHIYIGVFEGENIISQIRYATSSVDSTSDQIGVFLRQALRESSVDLSKIKGCAISSVVPHLNYSLGYAVIKYFGMKPFFISMETTDLDMTAVEAHQVGADRIASCIGAIADYPNKDLLIIDLGTATTFDLVTKDKKYLSGSIMPGVKLSLNALCQGASQLSSITIVKPEVAIGYDTKTNIRSGLYYGHLGALRELKTRSLKEFGAPVYTIATGGFAGLFKDEGIFDEISPDLILHGIRIAFLENNKKGV
ncbi:type III pantothenate kinase [Francisella noatunensis]|uniref:Type III pantothenate kinase n=1 Tax=Francisella noatunensis TaxID=657445 RepID=A0A9Q2KQU1_9GAMM|nr:type III pantothenate kinase [Francisella noatunensis]MBK2028461.1 type III pantothenate kinase [Francisella noatunensis]MBK2033963.1 type III pantothenate kinase [Francisella noatunensis]MBK2049058.1 type III pantothenate kinase [Francisella noatunensis]MBK2049508.1 type III pantothenate kinase [Francisella noatunensis]MBK2050975.1 type III pantothenate kinase [Francisella noatunensis]